jgi:hypothetical protein
MGRGGEQMLMEQNEINKGISNEQFIRDFESDIDPARPFHHADHVRLAFAYLSMYPALQALDNFCRALKRFAETRGKTQLYHETITYAYFFLIRERMARCENANWQGFAEHNSDLFAWNPGILRRYYTEAMLRSDLARRVFLLPDKCLHEAGI